MERSYDIFRKFHDKTGIKGKPFADLLAIDTTTLSQYRHGNRTFTPDFIAKLAKIFPDFPILEFELAIKAENEQAEQNRTEPIKADQHAPIDEAPRTERELMIYYKGKYESAQSQVEKHNAQISATLIAVMQMLTKTIRTETTHHEDQQDTIQSAAKGLPTTKTVIKKPRYTADK